MKRTLLCLLVLANQSLTADTLYWRIKTDPELIRYKTATPDMTEGGSLGPLYETLRALPAKLIPTIFDKHTVIKGDTIPFPKGFTIPACSRLVFGNTIYQPKFITTHLHPLDDSFLVAFVYSGEDEELAKRSRRIEIGFKWDDPFGIPYKKLSDHDLAIWELIRGAELLRAIVTSDTYRKSMKPMPKADPFDRGRGHPPKPAK